MCFASSDLDDIFNRVLAAFDFYEEMERRMLAGADSDRPEQDQDARTAIPDAITRQPCHPLTLFLAEYDREHKTEFSRTLCVYLMNERSLRKTAEQLFIHRNTVLYRLEKMRTLYAMYPDLAVPEERAYVLFSLLLLRALSVFG